MSDRATGANEAPPLADRLHDVVDGLAERDGLLLALDFDGTLAPITDRPDEAAIAPAAAEAIDRLTDVDEVRVPVVSGRQLADLRERVDADAYAGNHGLELRVGGETHVAPEAETARDALAEAVDAVEERVADVDGAVVERKGVTATVHYRTADAGDVPRVEEAVREAAGDRDDLRVTEGKAILEIRPDVDWDKGAAVERLTDDLVPDGEDWLRVYVGDDRTDEDAFATLSDGLGVKVGGGTTRADVRVDDPEAAAAFLTWLADHGATFLRRDPDDGPVPR
ncbi:trehalose-phosphatase [Halomicrobium salinisoli]|uniref:trehalose-phosphatase n=1 Tax=Halomicrobium salinisoli TaxID=2878391 RepID=UPI001CF0A8BE|nr:trehalose-phosphatase [Halomicrobium salinisoli]